MKRTGAILSLALLLVMLACPFFSYASGLELVNISPEDGKTGLQPMGVAIKMTFNENMTDKAIQEENKDCFTVTDSSGNKMELIPVYDAKKYPNDVWLILKDNLISNTEYKLVISEELISSDGNRLGEEYVSKFKIRNTKTDTTVNMVLMVGMMGGMVFFSSMDAKRKVKKEAEEHLEEETLNPYKIAKEKGISVEEAIKQVDKEKAKAAKKRAKKQEEEAKHRQIQDNAKRVSQKRPIAAAGGKTPESVLKRNQLKREAEEKAKEERLAKELARQEKNKKNK
ncbi:Ig-like domain-containing protein [Sinanaerobacter sp. ZZT-01]|uniref:Ig-like domain-containing protein n=1 Tax=Sinanaerobacter sp. ZZT-01 TaxID=3111540 RepID=UPI002D7730FE|nr:Ig-like domain-containing protein [Sinanaerobacter sp. ZZT-01]WRR94628.1 Ig-like domain-containing protein [Sinanaerobacter sp. ZZT-01]